MTLRYYLTDYLFTNLYSFVWFSALNIFVEMLLVVKMVNEIFLYGL